MTDVGPSLVGQHVRQLPQGNHWLFNSFLTLIPNNRVVDVVKARGNNLAVTIP